ncbi:MAG: UDP-N-acetylmuramoyl-L-alanyl-D-glutamate--2,6-diaminopimelate ligase [Bacteroidales bacterium]|nr:UDP-N-acetylmuramoyl-L-alanyl-D-glutamate--2,6-diaminopimelate ligase [Bacteroidales bacterium]
MQLETILQGIAGERLNYNSRPITQITFDSRSVEKGSLFVAQVGVHTDGHNYIDKAVAAGASAVVCEHLPENTVPQVCYIVVNDSDEALGIAASNFYNNPSHKLALVGITGTNGKTTTVTLLHEMFRLAGHKTGLLSTIVNKIDDKEVATTHTTPDAVEINRLLAEMVNEGCTHCFMEVSSHAIIQKRIAGLHFTGAIFSNITHDHLDFHKTMAAYIAAKKAFFDALPSTAWALTNRDDRNGMVMVQNTKAHTYTYSLHTAADFNCKVVESTFAGTLLTLNGKEVWTRLVGQFNAYNSTAIYAAARLCGTSETEALRLISALHPAPGRFQHVDRQGITAIVDYAHTPDALENVLRTINEVQQSHQRLIVVVGCGGDRDPLKRPIMAHIAAQHSDRVILTSDNPRTEDPEVILDNMETGLSNEEKFKTLRITDRRQAIKSACMMAHKDDIILVAGKGHETYQEVNGVRHHFDDVEELNTQLESINNNLEQ